MVQFGDGHREPHPPVADSDEELVEAVRFLGESVSPTRPFDDAHPTMTLALGDRYRLHAIGLRPVVPAVGDDPPAHPHGRGPARAGRPAA